MHLPCKQAHVGALPALPTISGLVAQPAERPVVCGRVEGATPFGSANFEHSYRRTLPGLVSCVSPALMKQPSGLSARSVAANALGLGPRDRRCKSCRADHFRNG